MSTAAHPSVALMVLNHDGAELLAWGLPSVIAEAERYPGEATVVVVDNDSHDGSLALLAERFPEVQVERSENRVLVSYNDVVARASVDAVLLLNNDLRLEEGCLEALVRELAPDVFAVSARLSYEDGAFQAGRTRGRVIHGLMRFERSLDQDAAGPTSFCPGGACLVRRDRFLQLGGYDALFLPGYLEDADLCFRAWARGWRSLYAPDARMIHIGGATLERLYDQQARDRMWLRNELLFAWKNLTGYRAQAAAWMAIRLVASVAKGTWGVTTGALREARARRSQIEVSLSREDVRRTVRLFAGFR